MGNLDKVFFSAQDNDDEIVNAIKGDLSVLERTTTTTEQVQKSARIQIGLSVLQKRLAEKVYETSMMSARSSIRWAKRAFIVSLVALVAAMAAAFLGGLDYLGDRSWREQQLNAVWEIKGAVVKLVNK